MNQEQIDKLTIIVLILVAAMLWVIVIIMINRDRKPRYRRGMQPRGHWNVGDDIITVHKFAAAPVSIIVHLDGREWTKSRDGYWTAGVMVRTNHEMAEQRKPATIVRNIRAVAEWEQAS